MMMRLFGLFTIFLAATTTAALGDSVAGQYEYMNNCAACHGEAATGDGPLVTFFKEPVPDLTRLSRDNDGDFPFHETLMIVDGRAGLRGHGDVMPVWGDTFQRAEMAQAGDDESYLVSQGRLLSLVEYLVTVQQD